LVTQQYAWKWDLSSNLAVKTTLLRAFFPFCPTARRYKALSLLRCTLLIIRTNFIRVSIYLTFDRILIMAVVGDLVVFVLSRPLMICKTGHDLTLTVTNLLFMQRFMPSEN
jgi:hypothetical protein